ncbi:S-layer homology domain-containing protein [Paenibacillus oenotherae]|uniref:S-layer homology domain-containing protein n=1 Tax=Paenibacillus oenotherae TaxID=1435645 RepID=A0ABS7D8A8_9BACL|nr:S-layer homology domain-containing protein [Paenibacillus oenotherae]MBW7476049.1 S-layer homology domain-containing protein [Paenibacillus oenotherae]
MNNKLSTLIMILLIAVLAISVVPNRSYAANNLPSPWAAADIEEAQDSGLIPSKLNNQLQGALTREQFSQLTVLLYTALTNVTPSTPRLNPFKDTSSFGVLQALGLGIVKGTSSTAFSPNEAVTREQAAVMLFNTLKRAGREDKLVYDGISVPVFADAARLSGWSRAAVETLSALKLMKGEQRGSSLRFMPQMSITREQGIVLANRIYKQFGVYYVNDEHDLLKVPGQALPVEMNNDRAKQVYAKAEAILKEIIQPDMTEYETELAIHDYLLLNIAYDYENYKKDSVPEDSYTMYGALIGGIAVCQGYAYSAQLLLEMAGIEAHVVTGTANGIAHAWNKVKIGGEYYNLDVTWDDPVPDVSGRVTYGYFNVTDEELSKDHKWSDKLPAAKSVTYNYFAYNGLTVGTPAEFEARIASAIKSGMNAITLKRMYKAEEAATDWSRLIGPFTEVAKYSVATDQSGVITVAFTYR